MMGGLALACLALFLLFRPDESSTNGGDRTQAELDLRDGFLYLHESDEPFTGNLVEEYSPNSRKLEIAIRDGKADGLSRGWYESGQMEVRESFQKGVSNGLRTRWYPNGNKKSEASIVKGKIVGRFVQWHENGRMAATVNMIDGKPDGLAEAWHPSGRLKSRVALDHGVPGPKEFFPDEDSQSVASAKP